MRFEMHCTNPKMRKLMGRYEFGLLSSEEQREFEAHLLECEACFEELYSMTPVVQRMKENPDLFLRELEVKEPAYAGILRRVTTWLQKSSSGVRNIVRPKAQPVPSFVRILRIGVPVAFAISIALILIHRSVSPPGKYASLAIIEPSYYKPVVIRNGVEHPEAERLFEEAMAHYSRAEYAQAMGKLSKSIHENPHNADAHFYLGSCYLLQGEADQAIKHLDTAIELDGKAPEEKYRWFLGNAYLLNEEVNRALDQFEKVVDLRGEYQHEAKEMISRIEEIRQDG